MSTTRIIGRAQQREQLRAALVESRTGRGATVVLAGDAGAGKTTLLADLGAHAEAEGWLVITGHCAPVGDAGLPYLPVVEALRHLERHHPDAVAEAVRQRPALASLLPHLAATPTRPSSTPHTGGVDPLADAGPSPDELARGQLFEAVLRSLLDVAARRPVLLVLEDLHWADRSTRDLLAFLARTHRDTPVAVIASYRSDDLHRRHPLRPLLAELGRLPQVTRLTVPPLSVGEVAELVEQVTGAPGDPQHADELHRRSGGNPFYAEELLRQPSGSRLPADLADLLLDRSTALPDDAQEVLRVASVAGARVRGDVLEAVSTLPPDALEQGLRAALEAGLLVHDDDGEGYAFRHALLQEAIYSDLLPGERTRWHSRYADVLAGETAATDGRTAPRGSTPQGSLGELAHHRLQARRDAEALETLVAAAREASALAASGEALAHLERALEILERVPSDVDRLEILQLAAAAAYGAGEPRRAVTLGRAAVREADERAAAAAASGDDLDLTDPAVVHRERPRAATRERVAHYLMDTPETDDGQARTTAAQAHAIVAPLPESPLTARVKATWARSLLWHDSEHSARLLEETVAVADRVAAPHLAADALASRARLARHDVVQDDDAALLAQALERAGDGTAGAPTRLRILMFAALTQLEDASPQEALATAEEGLAVARAAGLTWTSYGIDMHLLRGWALMALGRWDEVLERALHVMYEPVPNASIIGIQAVSVLLARGDAEGPAMVARLRTVVDPLIQLQLDLDELRAQVHHDPAGAAERSATLRAGAPEGVLTTEVLHAAAIEADALGRLALAPGADGAEREALRVRAENLVRGCEEMARTPSFSGPYGLLLLALVRAGAAPARGLDESAAWDLVLERAVAAGRLPEQATAAARSVEARLAAGDRGERTRELARTALDLAHRIGLPPLTEQVTGALTRARLSPTGGSGGGSAGSVDLLTPREHEVLELLAEGASNGEIGRRLYISTKTASVHVSNILAKLAVRSRTEAAAAARRQGLLPRT